MVIKIVRLSQWRAYRKPLSLFPVVDDPLRPPFPWKWGLRCTLMICRISNGHISATGQPIHFMYHSRVGFFWVGGSNGAITGSIKSRMAAGRHLGKFQRHRSAFLFSFRMCRVYMHSKCRSRSQIHLLLMMKNRRPHSNVIFALAFPAAAARSTRETDLSVLTL